MNAEDFQPSAQPTDDPPGAPGSDPRSAGLVLIVAIFLLSLAGLVYELIGGAVSSYLLGDSVTQFSITIGVFLSAMGVGSFLSQFVRAHLLANLITVNVAVGLIGGCSALAGFAAFAYTDAVLPVLLGFVGVVGVLVGLEIPLVVRLLRERAALHVSLANVLGADYLGALAASLLFPFVLVPQLGLVQAAIAMGLLNVGVAAWLISVFRASLGGAVRPLALFAGGAGAGLAALLFFSAPLSRFLVGRLYQDEIIHSRSSAHQRIVLTRWRSDVRLFLDGHLQFSSIDEYRYHESLVHPALALAERRERVLILGGGDGLATREVLRWPDVKQVDLVDLDPEVTQLFAEREMLRELNGGALRDARVRITNADAFAFLDREETLYDAILLDLPDPSSTPLAKLYSDAMYVRALRRLTANGVLVTQATSPFLARPAFWCIAHTIAHAGAQSPDARTLQIVPYHLNVPSFGEWGFILATRRPPPPEPLRLPDGLRYLTNDVWTQMRVFPPDMAELETPTSTLSDPAAARLYVRGYNEYLE